MTSCVPKAPPNDKIGILGLDYYPTTIGKYVVYDVDSIVYTQLPKDTIEYKYRIKEKLSDNFTDNQGKPATRIERYIKKYDPLRSYDSIPWTIKEVWMMNADQKSIQVVEGNIRYTKLIFPVQEKATWNGNAGNTLGEWTYIYDYIDKSENINNNTFNNTLRVKQKDDRTLISYQYYTEKYAKNVGLVYREITDLLSNNIIAGKPVESRIESGVIYKQTLVTYGHE
jgi:hypothetical protein